MFTVAAILGFAVKLLPILSAILAVWGEKNKKRNEVIEHAEQQIKEGTENKTLSKEDRASLINAGISGIGRVP